MEKDSQNLDSQNAANNSPKIVNFLQKIEGKYKMKISEILENEKISFEDFKNILLRINGIIREQPIKQREFSKNVQINNGNAFFSHVGYLPPQDKEKYLQKLYEIYNSDESLENKAMMMYYAIQFIHPFGDGNGRTGRFLYELISKNYNLKNENFEEILKNTEWRKSFALPDAEQVWTQIDWQLFKSYNLTKMPRGIYTGIMLDTYDINQSLKEHPLYTQAQKILDSNYISDSDFRGIILFKINQKKKYTESRENERTGKVSFDGEKVMESLEEDDLKYIIDEYAKYEEDKMNYVFDIKRISAIVEYYQNQEKQKSEK